jgi:hypothetical protein
MMSTSTITSSPSGTPPESQTAHIGSTAPAAIVACSAAALIFSARFWLMGAPGVFNADGLLPVAFVHELQTRFSTITQFQLPRVPSLFPDLTVYTLLASVIADYRWALFAATVVQVATFLILGSLVVARVAQRPTFACALSLCSLTGAAIALNESAGGIQYFNRMFATFEHFGPFCMSLASLLIMVRLVARESRTLWALLCALETLAIASNKSYVIVFVGPGLAALLLEYRRNRLPLNFVLRFAACAVAAGAIALIALQSLDLQPTPRPDRVLIRFAKFAADVGQPLALTVLLLSPVAHLLLFSRLWPSLTQSQPSRIIWTVACLASLGAAGLCGLFYADEGSLRYLTAAVFWPLVFLAVSLSCLASTTRFRRLALAAATTVCLAIFARSAVSAAASFRGWRQPLADCLIANKERFGLKDGLAYYWLARPTVISSGWTLQIEQMMGGRYFHWGNNSYWSTHSWFDDSHPPRFNYILPGEQQQTDLLQNFGPPSRVERCGGSEIWIYDAGIPQLK